MDVTPISKQNLNYFKSKSDEGSVRTEPSSVSAGAPTAQSSEITLETIDPVTRAEQAIGPLFKDEKYPMGRFSIDQDNDSGRYVYRLVDIETKEVLKQFPGDYVLRRVAYYRELQGIAVNSEV
jgi:uncharacterized FlaG/YvyC family protein